MYLSERDIFLVEILTKNTRSVEYIYPMHSIWSGFNKIWLLFFIKICGFINLLYLCSVIIIHCPSKIFEP